ncbi:hypothetical protein KIW84_061332 [Lathyrus oleraceus]|uniref:Uncharacterized protein n=1 Tax=Pisum sativum TaxID=3888 RepID=A0A9D4W4R3_PEA|nr:hypothetical protein KIW84_061332 [Pisum sativum]
MPYMLPHQSSANMSLRADSVLNEKAFIGISIITTHIGPFEYLGCQRPHGYQSRDATVFKDEEGVAYLKEAIDISKNFAILSITVKRDTVIIPDSDGERVQMTQICILVTENGTNVHNVRPPNGPPFGPGHRPSHGPPNGPARPPLRSARKPQTI